MTGTPQVSVVMSVYNGAGHLAQTMESVLGQSGCNFEFIIVDDGSTDATAAILDAYAAADARIHVLHQANTGLTLALARGCAQARGEFIARQDAGDRSLPGRLAQQQAFLLAQPEAVMAGCGVHYTGPGHEWLRTAVTPMLALDDGLRQRDIARLSGPPHHGGTMFRRAAYEIAGGYRLPFVVAQDIDLWLRLGEQGTCLGMSEALYEARLEAGNISSRRRDEQFAMGRLALACAQARRGGASEAELLQPPALAPTKMGPPGRLERARFHYFIASSLRVHDPLAAKRYYQLALSYNPFHIKALLRCLVG